jgi:hypothetical protein
MAAWPCKYMAAWPCTDATVVRNLVLLTPDLSAVAGVPLFGDDHQTELNNFYSRHCACTEDAATVAKALFERSPGLMVCCRQYLRAQQPN